MVFAGVSKSFVASTQVSSSGRRAGERRRRAFDTADAWQGRAFSARNTSPAPSGMRGLTRTMERLRQARDEMQALADTAHQGRPAGETDRHVRAKGGAPAPSQSSAEVAPGWLGATHVTQRLHRTSRHRGPLRRVDSFPDEMRRFEVRISLPAHGRTAVATRFSVSSAAANGPALSARMFHPDATSGDRRTVAKATRLSSS